MDIHPDQESPTYWLIPQGGTSEKPWTFDDADTGEAPNWTGWSARCQIRDGGALLATLRSPGMAGASDGSLSLRSDGTVIATLAHTVTETMSPTTSGEFDIEFINAAGQVFRHIQGRAHITQGVTTDD